MNSQTVIVTGGTGYIGSRLISRLLQRGHVVFALVRASSQAKLPAGCHPVVGDALDALTFQDAIPHGCTFVHLVGVSHPGPGKEQLFREIDLVSIQQAVRAAMHAQVRHFVYLSVAQHAPVMKAYQQVRAEGERLVRESGIAATFVRPWYVLGPGHWWPIFLKPVYWISQRIPSLREQAKQLDLVTIGQMVKTLVNVVERPHQGVRIITVPEIQLH